MFQLLCSDGKVRDDRWGPWNRVTSYAWALDGVPCAPGCPGGWHRADDHGDDTDAKLTTSEWLEHLLTFTRPPFFAGAEWCDWIGWAMGSGGQLPTPIDWEWLCPDGKRRLPGRKGETAVQFWDRMLARHGCSGGRHVPVLRRGSLHMAYFGGFQVERLGVPLATVRGRRIIPRDPA